MKIVSIATTHLDFLQTVIVSQELRRHHEVTMVFPGRSQDFHASRTFVAYLQLAEPDMKLDVALTDHEFPLATVLSRLEHILADRQSDLVVVEGATNAAVAGALAAARLHIPVAHVEAGRRSFNKLAPGEVNRLVIDRLADALFCSTPSAASHLAAEGIARGVYISGDVMLDAVQRFLPIARQHSSILSRIGLHPGVYLVALVEHIENRGGTGQLRGVISALNAIREPIVLPSYTDTRSAIELRGLTLAPHVLPIDLVGYVDWLMLASNARAILTDSNDVQREAYLLGVPCITLSETTEMLETVDTGWNCLAGTQPDQIMAAVRDFAPLTERPPVFGDGQAVIRIAEIISASSIEFGHSYTRVGTPVERQLVAAAT